MVSGTASFGTSSGASEMAVLGASSVGIKFHGKFPNFSTQVTWDILSLRITHSQNHQIHQILHLESSQTLINIVFINRASTIFHPLSF